MLYYPNYLSALRLSKTILIFGAIALLSASSYSAASGIEGTSTERKNSDLVDIRYRCDSVECEIEAVLDHQPAVEAIDYHWEFNDGSAFITTVPFINHVWNVSNDKKVRLSVYNQFCELLYGEASFELQRWESDSELRHDSYAANKSNYANGGNGSNVLTKAQVLVGQDTLRSASEPLQGVQVQGDVYIHIDELPNARQVFYSLSDAASKKIFSNTEQSAPFDLAGGSIPEAVPFDTRLLEDGRYHLDVRATYQDSRIEYLTVYFDVFNSLNITPSQSDGDGDGDGDGDRGEFAFDEDSAIGEFAGSVQSSKLSNTPSSASSDISRNNAKVFDMADQGGLAARNVAHSSVVDDFGGVAVAGAANGYSAAGTHAKRKTVTPDVVRIGQNTSRVGSISLQGYTVQGDAYIFIDELPDARQVSFNLYSQALEKMVSQLDRYAPFDLVGGSALEAKPFDTRSLDDGRYHIDVAVTYLDSSVENVTVQFDVNNARIVTPPASDSDSSLINGIDVAGEHSIGAEAGVSAGTDVQGKEIEDRVTDYFSNDGHVSGSDNVFCGDSYVVAGGGLDRNNLTTSQVRVGQNPTRSGSEALQNYHAKGDVYIFINKLPKIKQVSFVLFSKASDKMIRRVERSAPYDLGGGLAYQARPVDTRLLENGCYNLDVEVKYLDDSTEYLQVQFDVVNALPVSQFASALKPGDARFQVDNGVSTGVVQPEESSAQTQSNSELLFTSRSNRSNRLELAGSVLNGQTHIYLAGAGEADFVEFYVNNISMDGAPMEFGEYGSRGASEHNVGSGRVFDTRELENGPHVLSVRIVDGTRSHAMHAKFTVEN